jgi:hypothetical protein
LDISTLRFRASSQYRVVPYDRLTEEDLAKFSRQAIKKDGFGLLIPQLRTGLQAKEIDADTALLFFTLREPGPIPKSLLARMDDTERQRIADFVLDGILEVEETDKFISGAAATPIFSKLERDTNHPLIRLSEDALYHAATLKSTDQTWLATNLYRYNTLPATRGWRQKLADDEEFLSLSKLAAGWKHYSLRKGWYYFQPYYQTNRKTQAKLYISPKPAALPEVLHVVAGTFAQVEITGFKVGSGAYGILRPDKLVAYFPDIERLQKAGSLLVSRLDGIAVQGVPFSAPLDKHGLLSWGIDPRSNEAGEVRSWRQWIVEHLASSLSNVVGQTETDGIPAWQTALARLELDGIDPDRFKPSTKWIETYA